MRNLYFENSNDSYASRREDDINFGARPFYRYLSNLKYLLRNEKKTIGFDLISKKDIQKIKMKKNGVFIRLKNLTRSKSYMDDFLNEELSEIVENISDDNDKNNLTAISILDRNFDKKILVLDRQPRTKKISIQPNTHAIKKQLETIKTIMTNPLKSHEPILKLFYPYRDTIWPNIQEEYIEQWFILKDDDRKGIDEQREFVKIALNTKDFAFLEGPPGSGKTTVLCELIAQLISRKKKILLCASTHVAIDNVLEKISNEKEMMRMEEVMPIRFGDKKSISDRIKHWQYEELYETKRQEFIDHLSKTKSDKKSHKIFSTFLNQNDDDFKRIIIDSANLICGTPIGIIKHLETNQQFDVLIVDEASKTLFTEFLVPALHAKRWVIVGDIRQLPPYIDDEENIAKIIENKMKEYICYKNACIDVFCASRYKEKSIVCIDENYNKNIEIYEKQCKIHNIKIINIDNVNNRSIQVLEKHDIVIGSIKSIRELKKIPQNVSMIRCAKNNLEKLKMQISSERIKKRNERTWGNEIAWRIKRHHEMNLVKNIKYAGNSEKIMEEIESLLPYDDEIRDRLQKQIHDVGLTALPSFLEFIQHGFKSDKKDYYQTVITNGMPSEDFSKRHIKLQWQHRMHKEIADFPHKHIYNEESLFTPESISKERDWNYSRYKFRMIWLDVAYKYENSKMVKKRNSYNKDILLNKLDEINMDEAKAIITELNEFATKITSKPDHKPWEIAILTFYRDQETAICKLLREYTKNTEATRYFNIKLKNIKIELCTVDRFQGHEADLVFLSMVKKQPTGFVKIVNRLNVALTRARYQCVIVGNNKGYVEDNEKYKSIVSVLANEISTNKKMWDD